MGVHNVHNHPLCSALVHYHSHLNIARELKDSVGEACALCNLGKADFFFCPCADNCLSFLLSDCVFCACAVKIESSHACAIEISSWSACWLAPSTHAQLKYLADLPADWLSWRMRSLHIWMCCFLIGSLGACAVKIHSCSAFWLALLTPEQLKYLL